MARETAAQKNARTKAVLDERVRHFTETPNFYGQKLTPVQVRSAVVHEYMNGFSWRLRDMGIETDRYFKMAQALPSAFSWDELRGAQKNPSKKKPAPPAYRSPAPEDCVCGSGLAPTREVPLSQGRRACSRCYDEQRRFYRDEAHPSGGGEYGDDPTSGSGWHYSRNPPQRYTVTEGGRRVRLAGGNVFSSKGEAQRAVQFLRATEGGDYRVRAIKPGESVGRVAVANGKKSTPSRKKRGATGVRRSMKNGRTTAQTETSNPFATAHDRMVREWYAAQTDNRLRSLYTGAWDANDADGARYAVAEMKRRGFDTSMYRWPGP